MTEYEDELLRQRPQRPPVDVGIVQVTWLKRIFWLLATVLVLTPIATALGYMLAVWLSH